MEHLPFLGSEPQAAGNPALQDLRESLLWEVLQRGVNLAH